MGISALGSQDKPKHGHITLGTQLVKEEKANPQPDIYAMYRTRMREIDLSKFSTEILKNGRGCGIFISVLS